MRIAALLLAAAISLSSCAGPESLSVRVRNHAAHNLRVATRGGTAGGQPELVYPGNFSRAHSSVMLVHAPEATLRVSVAPATVSDGAGGYKFRHVTLREFGQNDVVFEVMVDNENRTWMHARDGMRLPYPSERVGHALE
jgi:hypothetical protein